MWNNLPIEISSNILHRLPVKTLIKCTILSKSFLSLITSHEFISIHIAHYANTHLLLRYFSRENQEIYHLDADNDTFSGFQTQGLLLPFENYPGKWFTVVGCVNGVLCLVNDYRMEGTLIVLWNPSIRKFFHVPEPIIIYRTYGPYESVCGFGFDPISDDYKVVRLVELDDEISETQVEVFSLKSGCWRVIGVGPCYSIKDCSYGYTPRFVNGSVYWLGKPYRGLNRETVLLKFDFCTETFETIQLPVSNEATFTRVLGLYIQESKGMLTLIKNNYNHASKTCSAWILKEEGDVKSWTKFFDFDIDIAKLFPLGIPFAFSFRKNGEVVMVKSCRGGYPEEEGVDRVVISVDPVRHSGATLRKINADPFSFYLCTYVESMVLFKEGKGIEEQNRQLDLI